MSIFPGSRSSVKVALSLMVIGWASATQAEIPDELFEALGLERNAAPDVLYDAVVKRYRDVEQGGGEGKFADLWEPIPFSMYLNPRLFYKPPELDIDVSRSDYVNCHQGVTPGWVHSWQDSVHGDLDAIRELTEADSRYYKRAMIKEVEDNLQSMSLLSEGDQLEEVACIDCHMGVGVEGGNHKADLKLPDAGNCGESGARMVRGPQESLNLDLLAMPCGPVCQQLFRDDRQGHNRGHWPGRGGARHHERPVRGSAPGWSDYQQATATGAG